MPAATDAELARILAAAELWAHLEADGAEDGQADGPLLLIAGWEDAHPACIPSVAADRGARCRACPTGVVVETLRTRRPARDRCPFGVRLVAFPAPASSLATVAVLRLDDGGPGDGEPVSGRAVLLAAHRLRRRAGLARWQAGMRSRWAERHRTAAGALAQLVATAEELQRLHAAADRDLAGRVLANDEAALALHDTVGQSLVAAGWFLETARTSLDSARPAAAMEHLDAARACVLAAVDEMRAVIELLRPTADSS